MGQPHVHLLGSPHPLFGGSRLSAGGLWCPGDSWRSGGGHCLPAISFSKKGRMSSPNLDLSATASFSSCPQQTEGEGNGEKHVKF